MEKGNRKGFIMQIASSSYGYGEDPGDRYLIGCSLENSRLVDQDYISGEGQNCN